MIGSAIALNLLFHIPLFWGVLITGLDVLLILLLQRWGFRTVEAIVIALIGIILALFCIQTFLSRPEYLPALGALFVPSAAILTNPAMLYIAIGMLGATVMPHNLYLHSALVQTRSYARTPKGKREAIWMANIDSALALTIALFVNAAILIVAAAVFHRSGHYEVQAIEDAFKLLSPLVGAGICEHAVCRGPAGFRSELHHHRHAGRAGGDGGVHPHEIDAVGTAVGDAYDGDHTDHYCGGVVWGKRDGEVADPEPGDPEFQLSFAVVPLVMFTGDRNGWASL